VAGGAAADAELTVQEHGGPCGGTVSSMAQTRISSREVTAEHIGQNIQIVWSHDGLSGEHTLAGELESITQYQGGSRATVRVGPLTLDVQLGGPMELFFLG